LKFDLNFDLGPKTYPLDLMSVHFGREPLKDRECSRCQGTTFYKVWLRTFTDQAPIERAMCEGCKLIVEVQ